MKKLILATLLAATAFAPAAFAQSANSTVTLSNFRYTLTDLNPDDGVAPSATFEFRNFLFAMGDDPKFAHKSSNWDDVVTKSVTFSAGGIYASASTIAGTGLQHLSGASATASGSAVFTGKEIIHGSDKQFNSYSSTALIVDGTFTLSPGAKLTFYADAHAFASSDTGTTNYDSNAQASGWLGGRVGNDFFESYIQANAVHNNDYGLTTDEKTQALEITFTNYDFKPLTGFLYAQAWASGDAVNIPAVPEPSTYAMFFAGLGLIAFAKRRRK